MSNSGHMEKAWNEFWYRLFVRAFELAAVLLFALTILEKVFKGFATSHMHLETLIGIVILLGLAVVATRALQRVPIESQERKRHDHVGVVRRLAISTLAAIVTGALVYLQLAGVGGRLGLYASLGAACVLWMLSFLLLGDDGADAEDGDPSGP